MKKLLLVLSSINFQRTEPIEVCVITINLKLACVHEEIIGKVDLYDE